MELSYDLNNVVESLTNKLAGAEQRASQFEAVAIAKENKVQELEGKIAELEESLKQEKAKTAGPVLQENKNEGKEEK
ncbi:hypothetical protein [Lederbergia galactosidilytica]|uniref:Uncharacterized protein n=1 Tax=Lederbergia galactosidilytica TaxID=217031 RepID=A0A177ZQ21_9BACI|nr:hypothetical protein [Lederbergia galactosidilytica]OAK70101.1 hypothetical protein ABB05_13055 [Lederbergia galactosidilytica]